MGKESLTFCIAHRPKDIVFAVPFLLPTLFLKGAKQLIVNLTGGGKTASVYLPADRYRFAGVLSYLGEDNLTEYDLPCCGQRGDLQVSLEPVGIAERNIVAPCRDGDISLGRLNAAYESLFALPYERQTEILDRIAAQQPTCFADVRNAIDAANVPTVTQKFYCPLRVVVYVSNRWGDYGDKGYEYDGEFAARYENRIRQRLLAYNADCDNMAVYYSGSNALVRKLRSAVWGFERRGNELYGCITVETAGELTAEQEAALKQWIEGQNADGIGEGFEQQEIEIDSEWSGGRIYVSFWNSGEDYFIDNEAEFFERLEEYGHGFAMGGMT